MTAQAHEAPAPQYHDIPANPKVIRSYLLPEDLPRFDERYRQVMAQATETLDLEPVFAMLEHWRRVAIRSQQPEHLRAAREYERRLRAGEPVDGRPWNEWAREYGLPNLGDFGS